MIYEHLTCLASFRLCSLLPLGSVVVLSMLICVLLVRHTFNNAPALCACIRVGYEGRNAGGGGSGGGGGGQILSVLPRDCTCSAVGLAALGTNDEEVFEEIKNVLYTDDAVAGEAAGLGMGLLGCGSGSDKTQASFTGCFVCMTYQHNGMMCL
jgi:hypothetical protein